MGGTPRSDSARSLRKGRAISALASSASVVPDRPPKRLPMPRVRNPLSKADQRAVVLGEAGGLHELLGGESAKSRRQFSREQRPIGLVVMGVPLAYGGLV